MVDPAEVGHDDGHRQGDHQHSAERADGAEDLPRDGVGNHVAVPAGGNGHIIGQRAERQTSARSPAAARPGRNKQRRPPALQHVWGGRSPPARY